MVTFGARYPGPKLRLAPTLDSTDKRLELVLMLLALKLKRPEVP